MHIIHFSDTHLGHQQYPKMHASGLNQRELDHYEAFHAVIDAAVLARPDVVIHAGDLFDGVRPSNRALREAMKGFLKLSAAGIETILIAGNHEHPKLRSTGSSFGLFEHLPHVHPVFKGKVESFPIANGLVHAIPQCNTPDELQAQVETISPSATDVLVLHGAVHDLEAFHHAEFNEQSLNPNWFGGYGYVALGHYHGAQQVAPNAWYCGAPDRVSMRESGEEKGYLEVKDGVATFHALPGRSYQDLPIVHAEGLDAAGLDAAVHDALATVQEGAVARLRIDGISPSLRGNLDQKSWRAPNALYLDLKLAWADHERAVRGAVEFGGLADEFEAFAAQHVVDDLQRDRLLEMARNLLQEAS